MKVLGNETVAIDFCSQ